MITTQPQVTTSFLVPTSSPGILASKHTISKSFVKVEYHSVATLVAKISQLQTLLCELYITSTIALIIQCNNLSIVHLLTNPILHARTKHIKIDLYYVREKVLQKQIQICHLPSSAQLANIFTKAMPSVRFLSMRDKLNVTPDKGNSNSTNIQSMPKQNLYVRS